MTGIGGNVDHSGSKTIKWDFIKIKGHYKIVQIKLYYTHGLGYTLLMSTQSYFRMEHGNKMTFTMYMKELFFKYGSIFLILYDSDTNHNLLASCHYDYITEFVGILYKCVTYPKKKESQFPREEALNMVL